METVQEHSAPHNLSRPICGSLVHYPSHCSSPPEPVHSAIASIPSPHAVLLGIACYQLTLFMECLPLEDAMFLIDSRLFMEPKKLIRAQNYIAVLTQSIIPFISGGTLTVIALKL